MVDHIVFVYQKEPVWISAKSIALRFYKLEDGVGQRVYVDMVFLACVPGDLIRQVGGTPLGHRGLVGLIAPPIKNWK